MLPQPSAAIRRALQLAFWLALAGAWLFFTWGRDFGGEGDAATYLLMADWFSPWRGHDALATGMMAGSPLPPLYPLLLGLVDGGSHVVNARVVTTLCLLGEFWLYGRWLALQGLAPWQRFAAVGLFALLPLTLTLAQEILSENLYLALSLASLTAATMAERTDADRRGWRLAAFALAGLAATTRSIGLVLVAALLIQLARRPRRDWPLLLAATLLPSIAWWLIHYAWGFSAEYQTAFVARWLAHGNEPGSALLSMMSDDLRALARAWLGAFSLFPGTVQPVLAGILGAFALGGLALRAQERRTDALYVFGYLAVLVVWPYPEHAQRFLYPAMPLLLYHALDAGTRLAGQRLAVPLLLALAASISLPSSLFVGQRFWSSLDLPYADFTHTRRWYTRASLAAAISDARDRSALRRSLRDVRRHVPAGACVFYLRPQDLILLGRRMAYAPPPPALPDTLAAPALRRCDYFLLTAFTNDQSPLPLYPLQRLGKGVRALAIYRQRPDGGPTVAILAHRPRAH